MMQALLSVSQHGACVLAKQPVFRQIALGEEAKHRPAAIHRRCLGRLRTARICCEPAIKIPKLRRLSEIIRSIW